MTTRDLETEALWHSLTSEQRSHAWRLMLTRKPYEALRVLAQGSGSTVRGRQLVAWLAQVMIKGA